MQKAFFHVSSSMLGSGSIIEPGNWGRILKIYGSAHTCWQREIELEAVRKELFSEKPSRFESTFCLVDEAEARAYQTMHCAIGLIYQVEIVDPKLPTHTGDSNRVKPLHNTDDTWRMVAIDYWNNNKPIIEINGLVIHEYVTASAIRIIRRL